MNFTYSILNFKAEDCKILMSLMAEYTEFKFLENSEEYDFSLNHLLKENPSIVFIDIDNSESYDPFFFLMEVDKYLEKMPISIAVSNCKKMAYNTIKSNFNDYLLKPFLEFELRKSIFRIKKINRSKIQEKICLKSYSDYRFIDLESIIYLKADNNTTDFYIKGNKKVAAYKTLKYYETILPNNFLRVHNSFLINTDHISRINFGKSILSLNGEDFLVPFSRTYKSEIESLNSSLSKIHSLQA